MKKKREEICLLIFAFSFDCVRPNIFDLVLCPWLLLFYGCVQNLLKGVEEMKKMKQKHKWSGQLLQRFMENPFELYLGTDAKPTRDVSGTDFMFAYNPNQGI